ncbi:hypothetical protein [Oceanirhabdus sp. W0125-5]|uniref:hypothetical protein n=1 Tax=Oceanirhabdus sp. W0125-5 TaxID=2999116 RepID=UPI0022F2B3D4|nr:hypothetical protein [Oceanirhabdus sp. W0125-5]WBW96839.1 hypothetical protein OW730_24585 [Oceanirhabdus sp. W0125-5]
MGKVDKVKSITVKSRKKLKKIAKDKFGMSDEGIERAKNIGKGIGVAVVAFTIGRVTSSKNKNKDNANAGEETITAIGGQVSNNTTANNIGKGAIVTKGGGVIVKKIVVNGHLNMDISK